MLMEGSGLCVSKPRTNPNPPQSNKACSFLAVIAYWYEMRYDGSASTGARPESCAVFRPGCASQAQGLSPEGR